MMSKLILSTFIKPSYSKKMMVYAFLLISGYILLQLYGCSPALADNDRIMQGTRRSSIPDFLGIKAILGEAGGLSQYEQEAIAHSLRNRGFLGGVYGVNSKTPRTDKERLAAKKTWFLTAYSPDVTKGSTHWLSTWDLKHCRPSLIAWRHRMVVTLKTTHFTFYKEVHNGH